MRAYTVEYLDIDKEGDFQWNINRANNVTYLTEEGAVLSNAGGGPLALCA